MKNLISVVGIVLSIGSWVSACPNLSGEYEFQSPASGNLIVTQKGCESIQVNIVWNKFLVTLVTDGKPYDATYGDHEANFNIPAATTSSSFDSASYSGDRFVWRSFDGNRATCEGKYSFTSFECEMFEHSLGYDQNLKAFTWTQIAWWRSENPTRYANDELVLKKIR